MSPAGSTRRAPFGARCTISTRTSSSPTIPLPGFGGTAALGALQIEAPSIPLIIVTGSLDEETAAECIKAGAADYVLKANLIRLGPAVSGALAFAKSQADKQTAEAALRISERRFRALVEESWDAVALFGPDGMILYGSPATTRLLGYELGEFVGRNAMELIHPDDRAAVLLRLEEVMTQPRRRVQVAARVLHKNGAWRHLEGVFTNLLDDPSVSAIVNNYRDVTDRRILEEQVILAQKMEAIGRLAGGVAHDFNNILTAIGGYTDLLLADLAPDDHRRRDVEEIYRAADRAAGLTQQLLAFSRRQVLQPKVISFNALVPDVEKMLRRLIGEDILFATVLQPQLGGPHRAPRDHSSIATRQRDDSAGRGRSPGSLRHAATAPTQRLHRPRSVRRTHRARVGGWRAAWHACRSAVDRCHHAGDELTRARDSAEVATTGAARAFHVRVYR